jgi:hypothetical protein
MLNVSSQDRPTEITPPMEATDILTASGGFGVVAGVEPVDE